MDSESSTPNSDRSFDVIVVGVGAVGACTCRELAGRGARVLGLDRFSIPNTEASYHGESRVFRTAYYEHEDYVPLLQRARELWLQLQEEAGESLYVETGGLYMGKPESPFIQGSIRALAAHHLHCEQLDRAMLRARYPQWNLPEDFVGVVEKHAGALFSERIVRAAAASSQQRGATLHQHEPVQRWSSTSSGVSVETVKHSYTADRLILCAGAWSIPLLSSIGAQLSVTRQVLAWLTVDVPARFQPEVFPIWGLDTGKHPFHYGFPILPGSSGVKLAHHTPGPPTTPQSIDRTPRVSELDSIRSAAAQYLPGVNGHVLHSTVCMYTNSPDGHFIIDVHPDSDRVLLCAGLSGHGFKFAAVLGEALAELALCGRTDLPIGFLSAARLL